MVQRRLSLFRGKAEVFGYPVKENQRIVVREGKRMPFFVTEKAVFDISLGPNAIVAETLWQHNSYFMEQTR